MTTLEQRILNILSDGKFHSGEVIAGTLNVSRAAVWKQLAKLKEKGADVFSVKGKGYQIPGGLDLLDKERIYKKLSDYFTKPEQLEVFTSIASTNQHLMSCNSESMPKLCLAEFQSAGKGRFGRVWHSPFARNIYLSLGHRLPIPLDRLSGLSLVIGCSLVRCLKKEGIENLQLKWPNDLRIGGHKAGGILIEIAKSNRESTDVVIGIGINWDMPSKTEIDQHWTNLKSRAQKNTSRNELVVAIVNQLMIDIAEFSKAGFTAFRERWVKHDELANQPVSIAQGKKIIKGEAQGVNELGALLVNTGEELLTFTGGEVSVRVAPCC